MSSSNNVSDMSTPNKADHLCVLVHGLWGNSLHLSYIEQSLRDRYDDDKLFILSCKSTASFLTYDGIEIGGERVAKEIEDTTEELKKDGHQITRFSIVGYSLGGLFARYAIGLLEHRGYFDDKTPVNFTTFASPHLGVRTPLLGYANHLWNVLGARTLSASGRQLFDVDSFRNTGKSLLSVLADSNSVFIRALSRFQRRTLYANIVNDRSAVYYTTSISKTDPYKSMDKLKLRYVKGYEPVILDADKPYEILQGEEELPTFYQRITVTSQTFLRKTPVFLALALFLPIGIVAFLINSSIQTFRSRRRIMLHEEDEGHEFSIYKVPLLRNVRAGLEDAFEITNATQRQDYLPEGTEEMAEASLSTQSPDEQASREHLLSEKLVDDAASDEMQHGERSPEFSTLALTPSQFGMIKNLDQVGFRKYGVYIHKSRHSHAALIVRSSRSAFEEGKTVIKHWLDNEFQI